MTFQLFIPGLYRTATTNENDTFTIPDVASGNCKLYSWEAMDLIVTSIPCS